MCVEVVQTLPPSNMRLTGLNPGNAIAIVITLCGVSFMAGMSYGRAYSHPDHRVTFGGKAGDGCCIPHWAIKSRSIPGQGKRTVLCLDALADVHGDPDLGLSDSRLWPFLSSQHHSDHFSDVLDRSPPPWEA